MLQWPRTELDNGDGKGIVRFAPVFNFQNHFNYDFGGSFGMYTGIAVRNVGYIYEFNTGAFRSKFRTYNLAVPLAVKFGNLRETFVYGGYEVELPFHYKEVAYRGAQELSRITGWFSDRVTKVQHAGFVGVQFKYGLQVKFKYYISEFHNQNFERTGMDYNPPSGNGTYPYRGVKTNIMYVSVAVMLDRYTDDYYNPKNWFNF